MNKIKYTPPKSSVIYTDGQIMLSCSSQKGSTMRNSNTQKDTSIDIVGGDETQDVDDDLDG